MATLAANALTFRRLNRGERRPVLDVFEGLSDRSRRLRFHGPKPQLAERDLARLADVGCCGREAVVALERNTGRAIAIARFVADEHDPATAEVAYEVVDDWQGRGVGRRLAVELARLADRKGVSRLRAVVDTANPAALALLRHIGRVVERSYDGSSLEMVVELRA